MERIAVKNGGIREEEPFLLTDASDDKVLTMTAIFFVDDEAIS